MSAWQTLKPLYGPFLAAARYFVAVVAVNMASVLIVAICKTPPLMVFLTLLIGVPLMTLLAIIVFAFALTLTCLSFYLFYVASVRLRVRNVWYFVLGGSVAGELLIAGLLATGSVMSASESVFWSAPHLIWVLFFVAGGASGFVFWLVDIWPNSPWLLGRH